MANPFVKAWKYLMALFSSKVDQYADPKVQIQQAIEEAQRQHQALSTQAAQVPSVIQAMTVTALSLRRSSVRSTVPPRPAPGRRARPAGRAG